MSNDKTTQPAQADMTPEYAAAVQELAEQSGMSEAQVLRAAIRLYQAERKGLVTVEHKEQIGPLAAPQPEAQPHADDIAVDAFASAMKEKLAAARDKGRHGWQGCTQADLTEMLHEHVAKGDPRDVANFCMFLWSLGYGTKPVSGMSYTESMAFAEGFQAGYKRAAPSAQAPRQMHKECATMPESERCSECAAPSTQNKEQP